MRGDELLEVFGLRAGVVVGGGGDGGGDGDMRVRVAMVVRVSRCGGGVVPR